MVVEARMAVGLVLRDHETIGNQCRVFFALKSFLLRVESQMIAMGTLRANRKNVQITFLTKRVFTVNFA